MRSKFTLFLIVATAILGIATYLTLSLLLREEWPPAGDLDVESHRQLAELAELEQSLQDLIVFVNSQQSRIERQQEVVANLREQQTTLESLVQLRQEEVDAILAAANRETLQQRIWDIFWGFILGLITELTAAILLLPQIKRRYPQLGI